MFSMNLIPTESLDEFSKLNYVLDKDYDIELDDGRAIIYDICKIFEESKKIQFIVSGFGQKRWSVDCGIDLVTIIEQLPDILKKLNSDDYNFVLDFYEQGIERVIQFEEYADFIKLKCLSRTSWIPNPVEIIMDKGQVLYMFKSLYDMFVKLAEYYCYDLANHPLYKEWMKG
ncbi:hypothetical protein GK047_01475 [Paenibacillus sp. SYP-B3998]|uniref:Uncharacterized protein n=1 Tax=Paenibacillus sp. SYP-B3998 TaxID=2678564 RepID=A0A6G3ZSX1_9BACL|nr:hypothetical protein [Paenibacillus sp. SYP-B3998]NEW04689.1 hypothetical protein [Paenibacillus sp. SYP-B3998]